MSYNITGTLITRSETETKGESFKVRTFGLKVQDGGKYDNYASFQLTQDRCGLIDNLNKGDKVKVYFDVIGRQWQGKIFTNLNAWRVEVLDQSQPAPAPKPTSQPEKLEPETEGDKEDLPF